ncbi:MAG: hypothetical protein AABY32_03525 [Nanoarchaeota archaeon]
MVSVERLRNVFYPDILANLISSEAFEKGLKKSEVLRKILKKHFGLCLNSGCYNQVHDPRFLICKFCLFEEVKKEILREKKLKGCFHKNGLLKNNGDSNATAGAT